jgi:4-amino-4-deoxy-L-arabinose transferase-like glycosyltransferase
MSKLRFFFLFVLTACLYFGFLGIIDLWNPDEPRYVEVAREMIALKNYLIPHLNNVIYGHKPPLFFWLLAGAMNIFHSHKEWVVRLIPALSGFFTVVLTYFYASKIFNNKVGFFSAIILSSSVTMMHLSRRCNIDGLFTLIILIAFIFLHFGILNEKKRKFYFILSCFFQGLGVIAKGPLAFIFPFFTLISYIFVKNDRKLLKTSPWFSGFIIILAVIAAWLVPAGIAGGKEYTEALIFKHTVARYAHGINHPRNFFYYFYMFPLDFMPWGFFLPLVIKNGIFNRKNTVDKNLIWFILWFLVNFTFMSFSTEKRGLYLLPLYPAISIVFGYYFAKSFNEKSKLFKYPLFFICMAVILFSIGMPVYFYYKFHKINVILTVLCAISLWFSIFLFKYYKQFKYTLKIIILYFVWSIALFNVYVFVFPMFNHLKSPKVFINEMNKYEKNWDNILFFNFYNPGFNFYLKKNHIYHTIDFKELKKFIDKGIKVIVVKKKSYKDVKNLLNNYEYKETKELGHRKLMIFLRRNK